MNNNQLHCSYFMLQAKLDEIRRRSGVIGKPCMILHIMQEHTYTKPVKESCM